MTFDEIQASINANQSPVKPDSPIPKGMGILAKKDMNIQGEKHIFILSSLPVSMHLSFIF